MNKSVCMRIKKIATITVQRHMQRACIHLGTILIQTLN